MMISYSPVFRPLFLMALGMCHLTAIAGAVVWAEDLSIAMTWWKWLLAILWYVLLSLTVAAGFTLVGEREKQAGIRFLGVFLLLLVVIGGGLVMVG